MFDFKFYRKQDPINDKDASDKLKLDLKLNNFAVPSQKTISAMFNNFPGAVEDHSKKNNFNLKNSENNFRLNIGCIDVIKILFFQTIRYYTFHFNI